ncbi:LysM domain protein [Beauveria brongniartii RCEF 3172]|uniref:LysM domain protein n=1 Tax=Beauveria brongniartii RCEF 3172 TaxID=1081107 RepID=A0A167IFX9_9HYPO|nr:LysM domain protein [Beauveria brongniartii RCEF 3172]
MKVGNSYFVEVNYGLPRSTTTQSPPPRPRPTTTKAGNGITTPSPTQPSTVDNCNEFHHVQEGESCADIAAANKISVADLTTWNPKAGAQCTGLWAKTYACVGIIGYVPASTTISTTSTAPGNGVTTPLPTQPSMVDNCNKFHWISQGNTCDQITSYNAISQQDFAKWNPQIGQQCTGMWADAYACVEVAAFSLKSRYHMGCSGDVYNNVAG